MISLSSSSSSVTSSSSSSSSSNSSSLGQGVQRLPSGVNLRHKTLSWSKHVNVCQLLKIDIKCHFWWHVLINIMFGWCQFIWHVMAPNWQGYVNWPGSCQLCHFMSTWVVNIYVKTCQHFVVCQIMSTVSLKWHVCQIKWYVCHCLCFRLLTWFDMLDMNWHVCQLTNRACYLNW